MAKLVLRDASVTANSVDLSDHVESVEVTTQYDVVDVSTMGATFKQKLLGLGDGTIKVTFLNDFASASVDATLSAVAGSNSPFPVVVKPTSGAVSASNPSYTMQAILPNYTPISGKIGEATKMAVTFENADQTGIVRATS